MTTQKTDGDKVREAVLDAKEGRVGRYRLTYDKQHRTIVAAERNMPAETTQKTDGLVDGVARALYDSDEQADPGGGTFDEAPPHWKSEYRRRGRAALAVVEAALEAKDREIADANAVSRIQIEECLKANARAEAAEAKLAALEAAVRRRGPISLASIVPKDTP